MRRLPQSTAYTVVFKLFLTSDHVSAATGKTAAITISKAGGAFGNPNAGASNATEISGGWYKFALDTTDTATLGDLVLVGTATACDTADIVMMVISATNGGMTALPAVAAEGAGGLYTRGTGAGQINQPANGMVDANVVRNAGTAITAAAGVQEVKVASIAANAITATSINADAITAAKIADGSIDAATFAAGAINAAAIAADAITDAKVASDVTIASVTGAVGSVTGAVGSVTGNVGGNVTGSVGSIATGGIAAASFAAGAINAAAIAADAIGASELAADAATEIGTAVWATAARTLTANTNFNDLSAAGVRTALGLGSANLDTQLTAIDDFLDTEIAAIVTATGAAAIRTAVGLASANLDTQLDALPTNAELATALGTADDAVLAAIATVQADTDNIQTRLPTALVSGRIDASVGAMASGAITATSIAADAIGASELATDAVDEIAAAVWAVAARTLTANTNFNDLSAAGVRAAVGLASANLDTQLDALPTNAELATALGTADDAVLTQVGLVKAKTDSLTFTTAGVVDAHVKYVAGEQVVGAGTEADPWGPAP